METTKKEPKDYNKTVRYSLEVAERFSKFRKEKIDKSQAVAAALLETSQPRLSYMERGIKQIDVAMVRFLEKKFHLNHRWLMHGELPMVKNENKTTNTLLTSTMLNARIDQLSKEVEILAMNLKQAWNTIEIQGKEIDRLTEEMQKNKR